MCGGVKLPALYPPSIFCDWPCKLCFFFTLFNQYPIFIYIETRWLLLNYQSPKKISWVEYIFVILHSPSVWIFTKRFPLSKCLLKTLINQKGLPSFYIKGTLVQNVLKQNLLSNLCTITIWNCCNWPVVIIEWYNSIA